jgi:hypothetical protein
LIDGGQSLRPVLYALAAEKLFAGQAKITASACSATRSPSTARR